MSETRVIMMSNMASFNPIITSELRVCIGLQ